MRMTPGASERRQHEALAASDGARLTVFCIALMAWRLFAWRVADIDLAADEAYYWTWSLFPDWGYYSKPPMIAWIIHATTSLFGASELALKAGSVLLYPLTTALIWRIGQDLFGGRAGYWAAALFITMPGVAMSSVIISTDVALLFFWALTLWAYLRAMRHGGAYWWLAGAALGLGLLSKYTMALFGVAVALHWLSEPDLRFNFRRAWPYAASALALLLFLPNLAWNVQHGFPTWTHTGELVEGSGKHFRAGEVLEFLGSQFGVFGLLSFGLLLPALLPREDERCVTRSLRWFAAVPLAVVMTQAFINHAYANWAAPAYVAAPLLLASRIRRESLLRWAVVVNLLLSAVLLHYQDLARPFGYEPTRKTDLYFRARGWQTLGEAAAQRLTALGGEATLLGDDRNVLAQLIYYARPDDWRLWSPPGQLDSQYDLSAPLRMSDDRVFLYISHRADAESLTQHFASVQRLDDIDASPYPSLPLHYSVYRLEGFLGYHR